MFSSPGAHTLGPKACQYLVGTVRKNSLDIVTYHIIFVTTIKTYINQ